MKNIDIDKDILKNIDVHIDIDIAILENINIDEKILLNINIDDIFYRIGFGISNTPKLQGDGSVGWSWPITITSAAMTHLG